MSNIDKIERLRKLGAVASISVAVTLAVTKIAATVLTDSLAVMSSMVDSLADIVASSITFFSVKMALKPPSKKHRYGLGKVEALSALAQSAFIGVSGFFIAFDVFRNAFNPAPVVSGKLGIYVMVFSIIMTIILVFFQRYIAKKTSSLALEADAANYKGDIATNFSIIFALVMVEYFNLKWFDPLVAMIVASYLIRNAYNIARKAIKMLLDHELPEDIRLQLNDIIKNNAFVFGLHDLRTRDTGTEEIFEFHLELDGSLTLDKAHELTHKVEDQIKEAFPKSQVIIHQEPHGLNDERLDYKISGND
ncbi:MAG: cation diffusion facilitator family transporter [Alphaproteobacteria bacterium]